MSAFPDEQVKTNTQYRLFAKGWKNSTGTEYDDLGYLQRCTKNWMTFTPKAVNGDIFYFTNTSHSDGVVNLNHNSHIHCFSNRSTDSVAATLKLGDHDGANGPVYGVSGVIPNHTYIMRTPVEAKSDGLAAMCNEGVIFGSTGDLLSKYWYNKIDGDCSDGAVYYTQQRWDNITTMHIYMEKVATGSTEGGPGDMCHDNTPNSYYKCRSGHACRANVCEVACALPGSSCENMNCCSGYAATCVGEPGLRVCFVDTACGAVGDSCTANEDCCFERDCENGVTCQLTDLDPGGNLGDPCTVQGDCKAPTVCDIALATPVCSVPYAELDENCEFRTCNPSHIGLDTLRCDTDLNPHACVDEMCFDIDGSCGENADCCTGYCHIRTNECKNKCGGEDAYCDDDTPCCNADHDCIKNVCTDPGGDDGDGGGDECGEGDDPCKEKDDCCEGYFCGLDKTCKPNSTWALYIGVIVGGLLFLLCLMYLVYAYFIKGKRKAMII